MVCKMESKSTSFKLNLPLALKEQLHRIAEREGRSVTSQINVMLRQQVKADPSSEPN